MFRLKEDRLNYGQLLVPPKGCSLVRAVGTTYSLNLEALMSVCIALGIQESTDSSLANNPFAVLKSLQDLSDKVLIFCEAGQIAALSAEKSPLMLLLDKIIVPVALKGNGANYPSFHPKTWMLEYVDAEGNHLYRFIVLSRNLTFDRSWDVAVSLDGKLTGGRHRSSYPMVDFLEFLEDNALGDVSRKTEKKRILKALIQDLPCVKFALEDKRFHDFEILPLGIGTVDFNKDPLMESTFHELLVISPFLSADVMLSFDQRPLLKEPRIRHLITRVTELHKIASQIVNFDKVYTVKDSAVEGESLISDEAGDKAQLQDIHAKMYLMSKGSKSFLYLGSMNASRNGLNRNVEMLLKLSANRYYLKVDNIEKDLFGPDEKGNPFEEVDLSRIDTKQPKTEEREVLEREIKEICRIKACGKVDSIGDKYTITLSYSHPYQSVHSIFIAPARTVRPQPFAQRVIFKDLSALELTELYRVTVKGETESVTRMILIPTVLPRDRDDRVFRSILKDKRAFVDYLAFILGDDYVLSALEMEASVMSKKSPSREYSIEELPAIYEKMLKAAYTEPERLREIRKIMDRISDDDVIPEEFVEMYNTFAKTLKLK